MSVGSLEILNVGSGDVKISFDRNDAAEAIRAKRIIKDMLGRGYALLVQDAEGKFQRAKAFDEATSEYVIADYDPEPAEEAESSTTRSGRKTREKRVPMTGIKATAVGRSAGG